MLTKAASGGETVTPRVAGLVEENVRVVVGAGFGLGRCGSGAGPKWG